MSAGSPGSIAKAAYKDTWTFAKLGEPSNLPGETIDNVPGENPVTPQVNPANKIVTPPPPPKAGTLQEVFNLDEGPVTLTVPATLSAESYEDLQAQFELFLRRAKRRIKLNQGCGQQPPSPALSERLVIRC